MGAFRRTSFRVVAAAVTCAMLCGTAVAATAAKPISVGVIAPKSHILGQAIFHAAELAATQINADGGINGRQIKLHEYDNHFSAATSAQAFQRAVQQDGVVAMVGVFTSEVALSMMPWSARLKTPLLITGAASTQIPERVRAQPDRFKYVFHAYVNSAILARESCIVQHDLFARNTRLKQFNRAVIFSEDAAWTRPVDQAYEKCLPKAGVKVVDHIRFAPDTDDFTPIFSRIKSDHANLIMAAIAHVGVKPVVQWHQQQVPAMFGGINGQAGSSKFWQATNGETDGVITGSPGLLGAALTDKTPAFFKAYTQRFGVAEPAYDAYTTFDAMYALKDAIARAGSTRADALVKALEQTDMTGVLGHVAFHGLQARYAHEVVFNKDPKKGQSFLAFQWQNGKQVIVWPDRLATGQVQIPAFVQHPD